MRSVDVGRGDLLPFPEKRDYLEQAFDEAPAFMAVLRGPDLVFVRANKAYGEQLHRDPRQLPGQRFADVIPELRELGYIDLLDRVFSTGEPYIGKEVPFQRRVNGMLDQIWVNFAFLPLRDEAGKVYGILIQGSDVTENVRLRQETADLLNVSPSLYSLLDPETGAILNLNDNALRVAGLHREEVLGKRKWEGAWWRALPESAAKVREAFEKAVAGETTEFDGQYWSAAGGPEGQVRWASFKAMPLRDETGRIVRVGISGVDITERKETERKLELAVRTRDEFISIASHELKTPITALKLSTQLSMRRLNRGEPPDPRQLLETLETQNRQLDKLTRLIEDMLDVSRIATGKLQLELERCDLSAIVRDVLGRIAEQFRSSGVPVTLHVGSAPMVNADCFRLEQVIINLLSNALKYGAGNPVRIEVSERDAQAELRVIDHGIGIAKEAQALIFERFTRGLSADKIGGMGLGLYITRQIVEAHGGTVTVESEPDKGSVFTVRLPHAR